MYHVNQEANNGKEIKIWFFINIFLSLLEKYEFVVKIRGSNMKRTEGLSVKYFSAYSISVTSVKCFIHSARTQYIN